MALRSEGDWTAAVAAALSGSDEAVPDATEPDAMETARRFASRAPAGYPEQTRPQQAARDLAELEALGPGADDPEREGRTPRPSPGPGRFGGHHRWAVTPGSEDVPGSLRLRRYGTRGAELTGLLPVFESFGLIVIEAVPYRFRPGAHGEPAAQIDDFGLRLSGPAGAVPFDAARDGGRLVAALEAVARGGDIDSLNRLVTIVGLDWRQVLVLRAYRRYRRQAGAEQNDTQLDNPLAEFPHIARGLLGYFEARFDPRRPARESAAAESRDFVWSALSEVPSLEQDRVLRGYLRLIDATTRTSFFAPGLDDGAPTLTLKFDSSEVPDLVTPRPRIETFVHGAEVEGIHLRWGPVARGGVRWSDRPADLRTEVLGLAQAQVKKNAVIVPTGAKGGFVCRGASRTANLDATRAYEAFVARAAGRDRQCRQRHGRHPSRPRRARRRRPVPRRRRGPWHCEILRPGERHQRRVRILVGRCVRVGWLARLRPQSHGHHRPGGLGGGAAALPAAGDRRGVRTGPRDRGRRPVR